MRNIYSLGSCCFLSFWRPGISYFVLLDKPLIIWKIKRWKTRISQTLLSAKNQECEQTWKIFLTASTKLLAIYKNKLQVNRKAYSPTIQYQTAIGDKGRETALADVCIEQYISAHQQKRSVIVLHVWHVYE